MKRNEIDSAMRSATAAIADLIAASEQRDVAVWIAALTENLQRMSDLNIKLRERDTTASGSGHTR
jgi:hypothetical protein